MSQQHQESFRHAVGPIAILGGLFAVAGILVLLAAFWWVISSRLGLSDPNEVRNPAILGLAILVGSGALWLVTAWQLSRGRRRGGVLAGLALLLGSTSTLRESQSDPTALIVTAVFLILLVAGWRQLDKW